MANVKHTTSNGEILTTECKRLSTALRRFTAFLKEYDSYYNEMLSELNSENANVTRDTCDTETVTMTLTNDTDTYTLTIKHNVKTPDIIETSEQAEVEPTAEKQSDFKFYTNIEKLSYNYFSLEYYKVRNNKIVGHGFEDFTRERIKTAVKFYDVKILTGKSVATTTGTIRRKKETLVSVVAVPVSVKKSDVLALVVLEYGENVEISKTYPHYCFYESFNSTIKKIIAHTVELVQTAKQTDSKQTDSTENDSTETDSTENDSTETDNKGYMKCEYFFSLNPKLPPKCKHCIYSDRDFCPADGEKYWGICEE